MNVFHADSANEAWKEAYLSFINENKNTQESRIGNTLESIKTCISIDNPTNRWVLSRIPMISPAFAVAEIFWILEGSNDSSFINTWNPIMRKYSGNDDNYYGAYGKRLKDNLKFDQIEKAYETLRNNPTSRQAVLQIWDGTKDLPNNEGKPNSDDIPCNVVSFLKIRNNKLEWTQVLRSNDLFRGTPYNFIQFTVLQEVIAGWLGIEVGNYFHFADSLHIYEEDFYKFSLREENINLNNDDSLLFSKDEFDEFFPKCINLLKKIKDNGVKKEDITYLKHSNVIPQEYKNLLVLPFSYLILKSNDQTLLKECEEICTNKLLVSIWEHWKSEMYYKK